MAVVEPDEIISATSKTASNNESLTSYLLLKLGDELYCVRGTDVREIARWREPVLVPGASPSLPGIINQRGVVLPVIDLRVMLGLPQNAPERSTRYVIVRAEGVEMALLVEGVTDLVNLSASDFKPVPAGLNPQQARFLYAVAHLESDDRPVALLDLAAMITTLRDGG